MGSFKHKKLFDFKKLPYKNVDGRRMYESPSGIQLPSITSILGWFKKDSLKEWREKVGEEEANKISRRAAGRGTKVHHMAEDYLNNDPVYTQGEMPHVIQLWNALKKSIDGHVDNVQAQEVPLYSYIAAYPLFVPFKLSPYPPAATVLPSALIETAAPKLLFAALPLIS